MTEKSSTETRSYIGIEKDAFKKLTEVLEDRKKILKTKNIADI